MTFGHFEIGRVYNRQRDIHDRLGGQPEGGISTPAEHPVVIAFTGQSATVLADADEWIADGVFRYFGEGLEGDMEWKEGNIALRDHSAAGKQLLLFHTLGSGRVRFAGEFACAGYVWQLAPDRLGNQRRVIVFNLVPLADAVPSFEGIRKSDRSLGDLRDLALAALAQSKPCSPAEARQAHHHRCALVHAYVLARADGACESCGRSAPFMSVQGTSYLEPHHIRRASDGGPDDPRFMAAVCPNCHREIHFGVGGADRNARLQELVTHREAALDKQR